MDTNARLHHLYHRILAFLICVCLLSTTNLPSFFSLAEEEEYPNHVLLEGYTLDIQVTLSGFTNYPQITSVPVTVTYGPNGLYGNSDGPEGAQRMMTISGNTGIITDIPVYYIEGTGNKADGGTGKYETASGFYHVEVPGTIEDDMYTLAYSNGLLSSAVNLTLDDSEFVWTTRTAQSLGIKERETKKHSYLMTFLTDNPIGAFPFPGDDTHILYYTENGKGHVIRHSTPISLGNGSYRMEYNKVPYTPEIDASFTYEINRLDIPGKTFHVYREVSGAGGSSYTMLYDGFSSDADDSLGGSSGHAFYPNSEISHVVYVENTSLEGSLIWLDDGGLLDDEALSEDERRLRVPTERLKGMIEVWVSDGSSERKLNPSTNPADAYRISIEETPGKDNELSLSIDGLPLYAPDGKALHYYYKFNADMFDAAVDGYHYQPRYNNGSNNASASQAYSGAKVYLQLTQENKNYEINVVWQDDEYNNVDNEARDAALSGVELYLWRYAGKNISDPTKVSSPVYDERGNQYSIRLSDLKEKAASDPEYPLKDEFVVSISNKGWVLPNYNENGLAYRYYLTVVDTSGGYDTAFLDQPQYIMNGQTMTLTRVGTANIPVDVDWTKGLGEKDYIGTKAELTLQRRTKDSSTWDEWSMTQMSAAASESNTTVRTIFQDVDLYDAKGQTFEYRVLETALAAAGGSTVQIPPSKWQAGETSDRASATFTYKTHGYEATSEKRGDAYHITNRLHEDIPYEVRVNWLYSNSLVPNGQLDEALNRALLCASDDESFTEKISYILKRNKQDYLKLTVESKNNDGSFNVSVVYLQGDYEDTSITMTPGQSKNSNGTVTGVNWRFRNLMVPKYDESGHKYTYDIKGEGKEDEPKPDEHTQLWQYLKGLPDSKFSNFHIDRTADTVDNVYTLSHQLLTPGQSYYIYVQANWEDNLSDPAERQVEAHVVALKKVTEEDGDHYYLYKDLTAEGRASTYLLNTANEFKQNRSYTPYRKNASYPTDEIALANAGNPITVEAEGDLYYTAVEYSLTYKGNEHKFSFYNTDTMEVYPQYILGDAAHYQQSIEVDPDNPLDILHYPYDIDVQVPASPPYSGNQPFNNMTTGPHSHLKIFNHSLGQILGDVSVKINWMDDDNSSGYRDKGYLLVLERSTSAGKDTSFEKTYTIEDWQDKTWTEPEHMSYQTVHFSDLDFYDPSGNPYHYSLKQYLMDESGARNNPIDEEATEYTTKNYFTTQITTKQTASIEDDTYKNHLSFDVTNRAANKNYTTQFYIVWHDEAAYKASSRADMNYALYRTEGDQDVADRQLVNPSEYTSVVKTAETVDESILGTIAQNPYYQKVEFSGLPEFEGGIKYHYYLVEQKTDRSESLYNYHINYYRQPHEALKKSVSVGGISGVFYSHREFEDASITPNATDPVGDNPSEYYIAENQVIINSITAKLNVKGVKKWVNVADHSQKPNCTIYLFRESAHDIKAKIPSSGSNLETEPTDAETYVDKTGLHEDTLGFSFLESPGGSLKEYDKYDKYGAAYSYAIGEYIVAEDGTRVSNAIIAGSSDGSQLLTNTFDPEKKNRRNITIQKEWQSSDGSALTLAAGAKTPYARFYVYRMECNYSGDEEEDATNPEAQDVSYARVKAVMDASMAKQSITEYDTFLEKQAGVELVETVMLPYGKQKETLEDLSIYAPGGRAYIYFVVEDTSYVPSYMVSNAGGSTDADVSTRSFGFALSPSVVIVPNHTVDMYADTIDRLNPFTETNKSNVKFINQRKDEETFITIKGSIKWYEGITGLRYEVRPTIADAPTHLKLTVQRSAATQEDEFNAMSWSDVDTYYAGKNGSKVSWQQDETDPTVWHYTITDNENKFRNFADNGNEYSYRVRQTFETSGGGSAFNTSTNYSSSEYSAAKKTTRANTPDNVLTLTNYTGGAPSKPTNPIQNILRGTYYARKTWNDGYDSYGLRPTKVLCMFQYKDGSTWKPLTYDANVMGAGNTPLGGQIITVELTKAGGWRSPLTRFPIQAKDGTGDASYYTYRIVELGIGYEDGKWLSTTDFTGKITSENYHPNMTGVSSASGTLGALFVPDQNKEVYAAAGNYAYQVREDLTDNKNHYRSVNAFGSYSVEPADQSVSGDTATVSGVTFKSSATQTSVVKNVLDQNTDLNITKIWEDDNNRFDTRPSQLWLMLERRICAVPDEEHLDEDGKPTYVEKPESAGEAYQWQPVKRILFEPESKTDNTWTGKLSDLPTYDGDENQIEYRVLECYKVYGSETDANGNTKTTISYEPMTLVEDASGIHGSEAQLIDNYQLTKYEALREGYVLKSVTLTNTLLSDSQATIEKKWTMPEEEAASQTATVQLEATYEGGAVLVSTVALSTEKPIQTWSKVPAFIMDENGASKSLTGIDATEIEINHAEIEDSLWDTKKERDGSNATHPKFTFTNTPLRTYAFEGAHTGDSDQETKYHTRPTEVTLKLQRSADDGTTWTDVSGHTAEAATPNAEGDWSSYSCSVDKLPTYTFVGDDVVKYQYRFVEVSTKQETKQLNVNYASGENGLALQALSSTGDAASGGYTYAYTVEEDKTTLTKTLLTIPVQGVKTWVDEEDKYLTRPTIPGSGVSQTADIALQIFKGDSTTPEDISVAWTENADANKWDYKTPDILPKYQSMTDTPETYRVTESTVDKQYEASVDKHAITNTLQTVDLPVEKIWETKSLCDKLSIGQTSVTFTLQASEDGTHFSDLKQRDEDGERPFGITLSYADAASAADTVARKTTGTIQEVPKFGPSGEPYQFRLIESEVAYTLNGHAMKSTLSGTPGGVSGMASYNYDIGIFHAVYAHADGEAYRFTNTAITASCAANITWVEKQVGAAASAGNDSTLVTHFRPQTMNLVLQRKISGQNSDWTDVTESLMGSGNTTISQTLNHTDIDAPYAIAKADVSGGKLPLYLAVEEDETPVLKTYEYRIVEKDFGYTTGSPTTRILNYAKGGEGRTITSDYLSMLNTHPCDDAQSDEKAYYVGAQTLTKSTNQRDFTSNITNTLQTSALVNEVETCLSGTVSWKDNKNALAKRPDGNDLGIPMTLRIQTPDAQGTLSTVKEVNFTLGNTDSGVAGSSDVGLGLSGRDEDVLVSWTKDESKTTGAWNYTISGLPVYDKDGKYITYSLKLTSDVTDYAGKAVATDAAGHKADSSAQYAYGKVTDIVNDYDSATGKKIEFVDFYEDMTTKLTVTKHWVGDEHNTWKTRPDSIALFVQSRIVDQSGNPTSAGANGGWRESFSASSETATISPPSDSVGSDTWTYEVTLPQYDISADGNTYQFIQYRGVEIGKDKTGKDVLMDHISEEMAGQMGSGGSSALTITMDTPHIGSYYLQENPTSGWDNGYSIYDITNVLDTRSDIVVKKVWNTAGEDTQPTSVDVELIGFVVRGDEVTGEESQITAVVEAFSETLQASDDPKQNWQFTYTDLPKYDLHFQKIDWEVKEKKVGSVAVEEAKLLDASSTPVGVSTDGKWLATYEKTFEHQQQNENDQITLTVTNTPAAKASLEVTYAGDLSNAYQTRFGQTKAVLQVRKKDSDEPWKSLSADLASLITNRNHASKVTGTGQTGIEILLPNDDLDGTYTYTLSNLPVYAGTGADRGDALEYRIIEVSQGDLTETYNSLQASVGTGDENALSLQGEASGGYAFTYSGSPESASLNKDFLSVTLSGTKTWIDESNLYQTRASQSTGAQDDDSPVRLNIEEQTVADLLQPTVTWSNTGTNEWKYQTTALPKYNARTDTLAAYSVEELYDNPQYTTTTQKTADGYDLTNTLKSTTMVAQKVWYNANNNEPPKEVTFRLQQKVGDGVFEEIAEDAPSAFKEKSLSKTDSSLQVQWTKLPKVTSTGQPITYRIVEEVPSGYTMDSSEVTSGDTITTTFINRELMDYSVTKDWEETLEGVEDDGNGHYITEFILQKKVGADGTWQDTANPILKGALQSTYAETQSEEASVKYKSYTFTDLPMFDLSGNRIYYQAKETGINHLSVTEHPAYQVEYNHDPDEDGAGNKTLITNRLNEVEIHVIKTDKETGERMQGVEFELFFVKDGMEVPVGDKKTTLREDETTDASKVGTISFNVLQLGTYILRETKPVGYEEKADYPFTLTRNDYHHVKEIDITNTRKTGTLLIYKQDGDNQTALDGVEFAVYKKNATSNVFEKVWNFLTGNTYTYLKSQKVSSAGVTKITGLPWGEYYIVEQKEADGYVISDTRYDFTIERNNVDNPIELSTGDDNKIYNYKNAVTFQKHSLRDDSIVTGGTYTLYSIQSGKQKKIQDFTIAEGETGITFKGLSVGAYQIKEITAPTGYALNSERIEFYIGSDGRVLKAQGGDEWAGNIVVLKDMPLASLEVTKVFAGDYDTTGTTFDWRTAMRPASVDIQLYQMINGGSPSEYGSAVTVPVTKTKDQYTYTFAKLPMATEDGKPCTYIAKEIVPEDSLYSVTESTVLGEHQAGVTYQETITNTASASKYITMKKETNGALAEQFDFELYIGKDADALEKAKANKAYAKKFKQSATDGADGVVQFLIPGNTGVYEFVEISKTDPPVYKVTTSKSSDATTITNARQILTKIDNETTTGTIVGGGNKTPKPGGTVAVMEATNPTQVLEENDSETAYNRDQYIVSWTPDKDWHYINAFEVEYRDFAEGTDSSNLPAKQTIVVKDYLVFDVDGKVAGVRQEGDADYNGCYEALKERYEDFSISYQPASDPDAAGRVVLKLSNNTDGMPHTNDVKVEFAPSVAAINMTEDFAGGQIMVEGGTYRSDADGKGHYADDRYVKNTNTTTIYAKADSGYCIDFSNLQVELVGDIDYDSANAGDSEGDTSFLAPLQVNAAGTPLKIASNGTFKKTLVYGIGDTSVQFTMNGRVITDRRDGYGNPSEARLVISSLPIPVDVGISFVTSKPRPADPSNPQNTHPSGSGNGNGTGGPADGAKSPKTSMAELIEAITDEVQEGGVVFVAPVFLIVFVLLWGGRRRMVRHKSRHDYIRNNQKVN